jgi:hypothetical protein
MFNNARSHLTLNILKAEKKTLPDVLRCKKFGATEKECENSAKLNSIGIETCVEDEHFGFSFKFQKFFMTSGSSLLFKKKFNG